MTGSAPPKWGENPSRNYQSSQWFMFELKLGPYLPNIDDSAGTSAGVPRGWSGLTNVEVYLQDEHLRKIGAS